MSLAQPVTRRRDVLRKSRQKRSQRRPDALTCSVCKQTIDRDELTVVGRSWRNEKLRLDPYLSNPGWRKGYFHAKCVRLPLDASWVNRYTRSGAVLERNARCVADVSGRRAGSHVVTVPMSTTARLVAQVEPIVSPDR